MTNPTTLVSQFVDSLAYTDVSGAGAWTPDGTPAYDGGLEIGGASYRALVLAESGLVAYWPLDDAATPAVDAFSTHDGTLTGATLGATGILPNDPSATACSFDADDERITVGTNGAFATDAVTLEAWFVWTGSWQQDRPIAARRISGGGNGGWTFQTAGVSGSYHWYINASGAWFGPLTTTGWTADTVWHLVATYSNAAGFAVYRNGVLLDSIGDTPGVINTPADCVLEIGRAAGVSASHRGTIAHVSIYDTALSAATALAHYEAGAATPGLISAAVPTTGHIAPDSGSLAFRFTRKIDTGTEELYFECGTVGSETDALRGGVDASDHPFVEWNSNNAGWERLTSTATVSIGTEFVYLTDWDGTVTRLQIDDATIQSGTRDAIAGDWGAGDLVLEAA